MNPTPVLSRNSLTNVAGIVADILTLFLGKQPSAISFQLRSDTQRFLRGADT
jgi:hypothetical protein